MKRIFIIVFSLLMVILPKGVFASELNEVTFISNTFDYKPLTGFKYEVKNKAETYVIDLTETSEVSIFLPDGSYTVTEILRPDGYKESLDMTFELPYKTIDGKDSKLIQVYPKHNKIYPEEVEKVLEKKSNLQDVNLKTSASDVLLSTKEKVFVLMSFSFMMLYLVIRYQKKNKERCLNN